MNANITRNNALHALLQYNTDYYHIYHALVMEGVMGYFASQLPDISSEDQDFWKIAGLLHDIDFELWPNEHCIKAPSLLMEIGASESLIRAICSHCYGYTTNIKPEHKMEKILFAVDELTGIIAAATRLLPSRSVHDLKYSSVRKKFKNKKFASGCSRETIQKGAEMLGKDVDELIRDTLQAMYLCEATVNKELCSIFPNDHNRNPSTALSSITDGKSTQETQNVL